MDSWEAYINLDVTEAGVESLGSGSHLEGRSDPGIKGLTTKIGIAPQKLGEASEGIKGGDGPRHCLSQ